MDIIGPPSRFDGTKLCWWCKYFYYDQGSQGYSDMTPGWEGRFECTKDHWKMNLVDTSEESFRNNIHHAVDCSDFESVLLQKTLGG